jgi:hypothetical protein
MPRATTAAWEVMPPRLVRMPSAAFMPRMSSGLVSMRTRMTGWPSAAHERLGLGGAENHLAHRRAGRGGQALGQIFLFGLGVQHGMQELVKLLRGRPG